MTPDAEGRSARIDTQEARTRALNQGAEDPARQHGDSEGSFVEPGYDEADVQAALAESEEVKVSAVLIPEGIEVRILIPHSGVFLSLEDEQEEG